MIVNKILGVLVVLPAILFLFTGLRWWVDPAGVAPEFGLVLADGLGLSSQIGDLSAFFFTLAICMLTALATGRRTWYYPPIMLLVLTAMGRILAWLVHDAALAPLQIGVEVAVAVILLAAMVRLPKQA